MLTDNQRQERNRAGVRKWYGDNRDDYNALRRERYAADKEAREKARLRAAKYREESPTIERTLFRELNGKRVRVFSTGEVAAKMKRTTQMLRNWQKDVFIPESSFEGTHRVYTKKQVNLILQLDTVLRDNNGSWASPAVKKAIANVHKRW